MQTDVIVTHVVPGYAHKIVHGIADRDVSDLKIYEKCLIEALGFPYAPFGTREYMRCADGHFCLTVHTN